MQVNVACAGSGSNVLVMNQRIVWNSKDKKQVEEAKKQIIGFKNHGYKIVLADGNAGRRAMSIVPLRILEASIPDSHVGFIYETDN